MSLSIKKRKWVFETTRNRIILLAVLVILSLFYHGYREVDGYTREYYGFPGEILYTNSAGGFELGIFAIPINITLWYVVACLGAYVVGKLRHGI